MLSKKLSLTNALQHFKTKFHFILLLFGLSFAGYMFNVFAYVDQQFFHRKSNYFEKTYVDPKKIVFTKKKPKSLVLIYIESLENTYSNKDIFGKDLLNNLNQFKSHGVSFAKYTPIKGTEWTIAALVGTQCGVPLKTITVFGNNRQGEILTKFLPKAKCLGDILADNGYKNIFMNGPSLKFAGVGEFFKDHQFSELYGKDEWLKKTYTKKDFSSWGLHDDDLFKEAKKRLIKLMHEDKLFNLTILTIDTHGNDGYPSKSCIARGGKEFTNTVSCTSDQAAELIEFIRQQGWLKKLNVVVLGDHLAMKNKVYDKLESASSRTIFNMIITDHSLRKNTDDVVAFDMLPTILDSLGIHTRDGKVALGYSAISSDSLKRPEKSLQNMRNEIGNYSEAYNRLW